MTWWCSNAYVIKNVVKKTKELTEDKYHFWDYHSFVELRNNTCSRLTLFNDWRGGEPARLFVNEWDLAEKGEWLDNNIAEVLQDPLEKALVQGYENYISNWER